MGYIDYSFYLHPPHPFSPTTLHIYILQAKVDISRGRPLSERAYDKFQDKLRSLNTSRNKIKEAMAFAFDYADSSGDVIELLEGSLLVNETPVNLKVLYSSPIYSRWGVPYTHIINIHIYNSFLLSFLFFHD